MRSFRVCCKACGGASNVKCSLPARHLKDKDFQEFLHCPYCGREDLLLKEFDTGEEEKKQAFLLEKGFDFLMKPNAYRRDIKEFIEFYSKEYDVMLAEIDKVMQQKDEK